MLWAVSTYHGAHWIASLIEMSETSYKPALQSQMLPPYPFPCWRFVASNFDTVQTGFVVLYRNKFLVRRFVGDVSVHKRHDGSKEARNNFLQILRLLQLPVWWLQIAAWELWLIDPCDPQSSLRSSRVPAHDRRVFEPVTHEHGKFNIRIPNLHRWRSSYMYEMTV